MSRLNFLKIYLTHSGPLVGPGVKKTKGYFQKLVMLHSKLYKVSKGAKIRNRYNQVAHLNQDTNGKVTN